MASAASASTPASARRTENPSGRSGPASGLLEGPEDQQDRVSTTRSQPGPSERERSDAWPERCSAGPGSMDSTSKTTPYARLLLGQRPGDSRDRPGSRSACASNSSWTRHSSRVGRTGEPGQPVQAGWKHEEAGLAGRGPERATSGERRCEPVRHDRKQGRPRQEQGRPRRKRDRRARYLPYRSAIAAKSALRSHSLSSVSIRTTPYEPRSASPTRPNPAKVNHRAVSTPCASKTSRSSVK